MNRQTALELNELRRGDDRLVVWLSFGGLPPRELSKNARLTHHEQRRVWREWRDSYGWLIREEVGPPTEDYWRDPILLRVYWRYALGTRPDFDNTVARLSPLCDALEVTDVIMDDRLIEGMRVTWHRVKRGQEGLGVRIYAAPPASGDEEPF